MVPLLQGRYMWDNKARTRISVFDTVMPSPATAPRICLALPFGARRGCRVRDRGQVHVRERAAGGGRPGVIRVRLGRGQAHAARGGGRSAEDGERSGGQTSVARHRRAQRARPRPLKTNGLRPYRSVGELGRCPRAAFGKHSPRPHHVLLAAGANSSRGGAASAAPSNLSTRAKLATFGGLWLRGRGRRRLLAGSTPWHRIALIW
jgi:hypothetical protein